MQKLVLVIGLTILMSACGVDIKKTTRKKINAQDAVEQITGNGTLDSLPLLKNYKSGRISSYDRTGQNKDSISIAEGETVTIARIFGSGMISHIWMTSYSWFDRHAPASELVVRMYWDGTETPCVVAPLGDFFGLGHGQIYGYQSRPFVVSPKGGLNCFWKMPFAKEAKITITNEGKKRVKGLYYYVDYRRYDSMPESMAYFHAQYRQDRPCRENKLYTVLDAVGRGHFVGCNLSIETTSAGWWGEGDDRFYIDGEEVASIQGTGTEDYFGGAWSYGHEISTPFTGMPLRARWKSPLILHRFREHQDPREGHFALDPWSKGDLWNVYRYHVEDPIPFSRSLRMEIEHGTENDRRDNWSSVAFWYQSEPHAPPMDLPVLADRISPPPHPALRPSGMFEAEDFVYLAQGEGGEVSQGGMTWLSEDFSDGHWLRFEAKKEGSKLSLPLFVPEAGTFKLSGQFLRWENCGSFEIDIDGTRIDGGFDGYAETLQHGLSKVTFGQKLMDQGDHTVTLIVTGRNKDAKGYLIGIDWLQWEKVEE